MAFLDSLSRLFTRPGEEKKFDIYNPEQQDLLSQLLGALTGKGGFQGGLLGELLGDEGFEDYAGPLKRQFSEEIVPGLAERFSGLGAQRSSGFQQQLAKAGLDLSTRLGEMRGQQRRSLFGSLLGSALSPRYHTQYIPGGPTGLASGLGGLASGIGSGLGLGLGGGIGKLFGGM